MCRVMLISTSTSTICMITLLPVPESASRYGYSLEYEPAAAKLIARAYPYAIALMDLMPGSKGLCQFGCRPPHVVMLCTHMYVHTYAH